MREEYRSRNFFVNQSYERSSEPSLSAWSKCNIDWWYQFDGGDKKGGKWRLSIVYGSPESWLGEIRRRRMLARETVYGRFDPKSFWLQVDLIQIEVVSKHYGGQFDTCRKSIRFNSIFRSVAGREAGWLQPSPWNFQIWIKFSYKSGILLTKIDSCKWKLRFPSIVDHIKIMWCCCSSVEFGVV